MFIEHPVTELKTKLNIFVLFDNLVLKLPVTSHLIIAGDVDGFIGRCSKHTRFPYCGQLLGTHQAE